MMVSVTVSNTALVRWESRDCPLTDIVLWRNKQTKSIMFIKYENHLHYLQKSSMSLRFTNSMMGFKLISDCWGVRFMYVSEVDSLFRIIPLIIV